MRLLFVSNGNGEAAIAERIASEIAMLLGRAGGEAVVLDQVPLVGMGLGGGVLRSIGPRRVMPSGGLVAMGNVRAFARDLRAGFAGLFAEQIRFLHGERGAYHATIAVGDVYAFALARLCNVPTVFVGTAKSVYVAPYGPGERLIMRSATRIFVRDEQTAAALRLKGVVAEAPGNVIADLVGVDPPALPGEWIGILPGSRLEAYEDGATLARVVRATGTTARPLQALFSLAPTLDTERFVQRLRDDGWALTPGIGDVAFTAESPEARLVGWRGSLGALLRASRVVLGQAGTANEAAAACGVPVVALRQTGRSTWYRMRQERLLGDAMLVVSADSMAAASELRALLADEARLARMAAVGQERMGRPGGTAIIAAAVLRTAGIR